ncbi:YybH family protein [Roseateles amylovorans]|jgi:ketosteroid isomerase-like protein|uniref:Nuclear transport factor 2 family protein n=1 Tax=Roseateles amylovorans TaxID=2978473 RepID=A0ABY6AWB1_9BURK|nr:nuclear transport factor 2 family protein [Roseateles amylovorans]UXH77095.1 nuclear transport factor 2 family protein [Roseateles amylovorans]
MSRSPFDDFLDQYARAVFDKDASRCAALYADDLKVFDCWERWSLEGKPAWRAMIDDWLGSLGEERVQVTWRQVSAWSSGDLAAGSALLRFAAIDRSGATLRSMEDRLSAVLQREAGQWRVVHQHTSVPISFADMKAVSSEDPNGRAASEPGAADTAASTTSH